MRAIKIMFLKYLYKIKNSITIQLLVLTVAFFSCTNNKVIKSQFGVVSPDTVVLSEQQIVKLDSIVDLIINISANDFYKNQHPEPIDFKNVKIKYIKKENGEELYILCGQFVISDKQEIQFATVKNADYEQWVGNSALTYCQNSKEITYDKKDLSLALKNKFDSLKK